MTNQEKINMALDGHFQTTDNGIKLNEEYLLDSIDLQLFNTRETYDRLKSSRISSHSPIWQATMLLFQDIVDAEYYPEKIHVSSIQAKKWFNIYGDFTEILLPLVERVDEYRVEELGVKLPKKREVK